MSGLPGYSRSAESQENLTHATPWSDVLSIRAPSERRSFLLRAIQATKRSAAKMKPIDGQVWRWESHARQVRLKASKT